jgi:hypothetical protein
MHILSLETKQLLVLKYEDGDWIRSVSYQLLDPSPVLSTDLSLGWFLD